MKPPDVPASGYAVAYAEAQTMFRVGALLLVAEVIAWALALVLQS